MSERMQEADSAMDAATHRASEPEGAAPVETSPVHLPHLAAECPKCFTELQADRHWWLARPAGSRLVGLVVARDDMPSVVEQRDELTRFGVPIEGFRHPCARNPGVVAGAARPAVRDAPRRRCARRDERARVGAQHRRGDPYGGRTPPARRRREGAQPRAAATSPTSAAEPVTHRRQGTQPRTGSDDWPFPRTRITSMQVVCDGSAGTVTSGTAIDSRSGSSPVMLTVPTM